MSLPKIMSSMSSEYDCISDENIPINYQDRGQNPEAKFRENVQGFSNFVPREEIEEDALEEETVIEQDPGIFSNPIYEGEGFRISTFKDSECGEPFRAQHICIDFAPVEGLDDNEHTISKCRDFWALLEGHPEIEGLRAAPSANGHNKFKTLAKTTSVSDGDEPTAIDWLKHDGLMSKAFATKQRGRYCDGPSQDTVNWMSQKRHQPLKGSGSAQHSISRSKVEPSSVAVQPTTEEVKILCKQLEDWDLLHLKSTMEVPGQTPNLCHAVMQFPKI